MEAISRNPTTEATAVGGQMENVKVSLQVWLRVPSMARYCDSDGKLENVTENHNQLLALKVVGQIIT